MNQASNESYLLRDVLKQVSRSFYLTLASLPSQVARQVGLAYLFARIADTIADAGQIGRSTRIMFLQHFKLQFVRNSLNWDEIEAIQTILAPQQSHHGERKLLEQLEVCFQIYERFDRKDQEEIRLVLPTLISGMEMDFDVFQGESESQLTALKTMKDLDTYIYRVAGCVGVFWTNLMCAHLPRIRRCWDREQKIQTGIRFGKGLQLTNILKDLPKDLRQGRCYIPLEMLDLVGLKPRDLLDKKNIDKFNPIFQKLVGITLAHLDQGWFYIMSIPRLEIRLRVACMWPIMIALRTLHLLVTSGNVLDHDQKHKISRLDVYQIMLVTTLTGGGKHACTSYWGHLRKAVG